MYLIGIIILFLYVSIIIIFTIGWSKIKSRKSYNFFPKVSIVIALRNEEHEINRLLANLQSQDYPPSKLEFIFVNDHSTDSTLDLLNKFDLDNMRILNLPEAIIGKKAAISMAVSVAGGDIILASDADCSFNSSWVRTMASYFFNDDIKLVSGPVSFSKQDGFFHNLQTLEFLSLIGSGAGSIGIQNPIFCNGANMAYRKDVFMDLKGFENDNLVSGDDVFLLHSVKEKYPNSVSFAKDMNAIVTTDSLQNIFDFINQRKRWVAKSSAYKDLASICTAYLVFFANFFLIFLMIMSFCDISVFNFFVFFYIVKYTVDLFLLSPVLKFFSRTDLIVWIFPFEIFYSFYIVSIIFLSFIKNFEWKDRIHNK